jgi:predicted PurR-regulated permease PerM
VAALVAFVWRVASVLPPFIIALFAAALLDPVVCRMEGRGVPRQRAVGAIFVLFFAAVTLAGILLVPAVVRQTSDLVTNLPQYGESASQYFSSQSRRADEWYRGNEKTLRAMGMMESPSAYLSGQAGPISDMLRAYLSSINGAVSAAFSQILWIAIIPLSLFWFLLEFQKIKAALLRYVPASNRPKAARMTDEVVGIFGQYVRGLTKVCLLYGLAATVLFGVLQLRYGLFLGVSAGVLYAVPYVGPVLAVIGAACVATVMQKGVGFVVLTVVLFLVVHFAFDYGVTPRVVGGSVGLHPLVNIFALMAGATAFGVWGMLLAVPVAASILRIVDVLYPSLLRPDDGDLGAVGNVQTAA